MAVKKEEKKFTNPFDIVWEWNNNLSSLENFENKSLQAIEVQKEWINSTSDQISNLEDNTKKLTSEWKTFVQNGLAKSSNELAGKNVSQWVDKLEEIGHKSQAIAFSPAKASLEIFSKSHANFESIYVNSLNELQKNRLEFFKPFEGFVEQFKQTQQSFLKSFQLPTK